MRHKGTKEDTVRKASEPHPNSLAITDTALPEAAVLAGDLVAGIVRAGDRPDDEAPEDRAPAAPLGGRTATGAQTDLLTAASAALRAALDQRLSPGLYLVATPIGHLADITVRALATLAQADLILCEDTRHSLKLLNHYAITSHLEPYHEHNAHLIRPRVLKALGKRQRVALISDAGTPLISDPGYKLVREALDRGYKVSALPGRAADRQFFLCWLPAAEVGRAAVAPAGPGNGAGHAHFV
jgi:Tetrapyrrole (Corrin/Porphyrin) Methylases